jgi:hypothetical protein
VRRDPWRRGSLAPGTGRVNCGARAGNPYGRTIDWTSAGVPGGIPAWDRVCVTVDADGSGHAWKIPAEPCYEANNLDEGGRFSRTACYGD